ncbi:MAG: phosphoglucosamine mutase [Syntrophales bacterium]|nr:phosphoglucosamine mutase [Syntrophales bacterium]
MGKLFGTDGIRGRANQYPMNGETVFSIGQAVTYYLRQKNQKPRLVLGRDTRISGYMIESALQAGITSMGGTALLVGVMPTPGVAFITRAVKADCGIVISASHNSYEDNGIKIFSDRGFKLSDDEETKLEKLILFDEMSTHLPGPSGLGCSLPLADGYKCYVDYLRSTFPRDLSLKDVKIVVDAGNGATYRVVEDVFPFTGADVDIIHNTPNGFNINDHCGTQDTENLKRRVLEKRAMLGLAFDGDGDRLVAVDENGEEINGDKLLFIFAKALKEEDRLKNNIVVSTVMSNLGFRMACRKCGIATYEAPVGDKYVLEAMHRLGSVLGGEQAGHIIFLDHSTTGDGIVAALQLLAVMVKKGKTLSELAEEVIMFPQKLINVPVREKRKLDEMPYLKDAIAEAESQLGDEGRIIVRYSGTENVCRVMVEASSPEVAERICKDIASIVEREIGLNP